MHARIVPVPVHRRVDFVLGDATGKVSEELARGADGDDELFWIEPCRTAAAPAEAVRPGSPLAHPRELAQRADAGVDQGRP